MKSPYKSRDRVRSPYGRIRLFSPAIVVMLTATGCTQSIRRDVIRLENDFDEFRALYAEQSAEVETLQRKVSVLTGRLDELEVERRGKLGTEVSSLKTALSTLKKRVPPPPVVPAEALESAEASAENLPDSLSPKVSTALALIREGSFGEAIPLLKAALEASNDEPDGSKVSAEILFWLGVAYDGQDDNREALSAYREIISQFPQSPLVPSALVRQAQVFERLGDMRAYTVTLEKLISDYPKSDEARDARKRLRSGR